MRRWSRENPREGSQLRLRRGCWRLGNHSRVWGKREKESSPKEGVIQESTPQRGHQGKNQGVGGLSRNTVWG